MNLGNGVRVELDLEKIKKINLIGKMVSWIEENQFYVEDVTVPYIEWSAMVSRQIGNTIYCGGQWYTMSGMYGLKAFLGVNFDNRKK